MKTYGWLRGLVVFVLVVSVPVCSAAIGPVTAITTDNPPGSPPYNVRSITVGNYTADRLGTGTTTVGTTLSGTKCPENDDFDINTALNWNLGETYSTVNFGGALWTNSNGDNPDFFLFESGGNAGDDPEVYPIFPDGSVGSMTKIPDQWKSLGYNRVRAAAGDAVDMDGQSLCGMAWAITDLKDAGGKPLTNDAVIMGLRFNRSGTDPVGLFAVLPPARAARKPAPADKATDVLRNATLSWVPGEAVKSHDVYLGTHLQSVSNASRTAPLGVLVSQAQDVNSYDPPGSLVLGQTYYWRIDEVEGSTVHKGQVWSFATEPLAYPLKSVTATASSSQGANMGPEKTIDGSGLADDQHSTTTEHMWLSSVTGPKPVWIQYQFDKVYKLREMWVWNSNQIVESVLGVGAKDVTIEYSADGAAWAALSDMQFARAPGAPGYAHNTTVDLKGTAARYVRLTCKSNWGGLLAQFSLSEVRFFSVPVSAREPNPASGATDVNPQAALSWRPGREAASHSVYVATDRQAVVNGTVPAAKVSEPRYEASVDLGRSYYWMVAEANEAETPKSWDGDVWTFTTADALVIDDFEGYNDDLTAKTTIFDAWVDGFTEGFKSNGSTVGNETARNGTFGETQTVHAGKQSMPMLFNNAGAVAVSEATRTFDPPQDWTRHGITTLVLHFYGDPANAAGQVYVKINGTKVLYRGTANALQIPYWTQWNIDLAASGANLKAVTKFTVGVEGAGKGILYVDDVRLYRLAPAAAKEFLWIEAESGTLSKPMGVSDDPTASGGKYISAPSLGVTASHTEGFATYSFTVKGGAYKIWGRAVDQPAGRNSFWVRIKGATLNTTPDAEGWCAWNFPTTPVWRWDDISNGTNSLTDPAVLFTLKPGTYTLEIAYREDGARLDALVITDATN